MMKLTWRIVISQLLLPFIFLSMLPRCNQDRAVGNRSMTKAVGGSIIGKDGNAKTVVDTSKPTAPPKYIDPYETSIVGEIKATIEERNAESSVGSIPKLYVKLGPRTHYYQIMRCDATLMKKMVTGLGINPLTHKYEKGSQLKIEEHREVWNSVAPREGCMFIADNVVQTPYHDITATSGKFFYLVRSCVLKKRSTRADRCNYKFHKTGNVNFLNESIINNQKLLFRLSALRKEITSIYLEMSDIQLAAMSYLEQCEFNELEKLAEQRRVAGFIKVAILVVAVVVGALTGGVAIAAIAGAAAISVGDKLFGETSNKLLVGTSKDAERGQKAFSRCGYDTDTGQNEVGCTNDLKVAKAIELCPAAIEMGETIADYRTRIIDVVEQVLDVRTQLNDFAADTTAKYRSLKNKYADPTFADYEELIEQVKCGQSGGC